MPRGNWAAQRKKMVERIEAQGVRDSRVLEALRQLPRERFLPADMAEFAYNDVSLPIGSGQTVAQPLLVAQMLEALEVAEGEKILEAGAGAGYVAAALAQLGAQVVTIEPHAVIADLAARRLADLGYVAVRVMPGDIAGGCPELAPFDGILVAACVENVPCELQAQLGIGGRLVIAVGDPINGQRLQRVRRISETHFEHVDLGPVRLVPMLERKSKTPATDALPATTFDAADKAPLPAIPAATAAVSALIRDRGEIIDADIDTADISELLGRIRDARIVLIGDATHGTAECFHMRAKITRELIAHHGFHVVAIAADWFDAQRIDDYVRHRPPSISTAVAKPFSAFPAWVWRNAQMHDFVEWLRQHNASIDDETARVGVVGLDRFASATSIAETVAYLDTVDPETAAIARQRYGRLSPRERDPVIHGRFAPTERYRSCEDEVVTMLVELLTQQSSPDVRAAAERTFGVAMNAKWIGRAEAFYRALYYGGKEAWNLRAVHLFEALRGVLDIHGPTAKAIVWAHNSHVGNAAATEMGTAGEYNLGSLCRDAFGATAHLIGFGAYQGTVAAAAEWGAPMEVWPMLPARPDSYERLFHDTALPGLIVSLRNGDVRHALKSPRQERYIDAIFRPPMELQSHYVQVVLPVQFDEYIWFDQTHPLTPLDAVPQTKMPETWPFAA